MAAVAHREFKSSTTSTRWEGEGRQVTARPLGAAVVLIAVIGSITAPTGHLTGGPPFTVDRTQSRPTGARQTLPEAPHAAQVLLETKHRSGLTWQQIADSLGVERRSVHHWVNGGGISVDHETRLRALASLVRSVDASTPADVRARLMDLNLGPSALQQLSAGADPNVIEVPRLSTSSPRPAYTDALAALRASRLRPLPRRRARVEDEPVTAITLDVARAVVGDEPVERGRGAFRPRPPDTQSS